MLKNKVGNDGSVSGNAEAAALLFAPILALGLATVAWESSASASSWSQKPAWANNPSEPSATRRSSTSAREPKYNLAPFAPETNNVALAVGQTFLMGDLSRYSDSIGTEVQYTYGVSEMFGFNAALGYSNHSDGKYSQTMLLTGLRTNLSWYDRVVPYAIVGLGFYKPRVVFDDQTSVSPVVFGLHLGPGIDLQLTDQLFFGAGLTFHDLFGTTETTPKGQINVGGTYTTFLVHAGVAF